MTGAAIEKIDSAHLRQWIGHEETVSDVIGRPRSQVRATFDMQPRVADRSRTFTRSFALHSPRPTADLAMTAIRDEGDSCLRFRCPGVCGQVVTSFFIEVYISVI
jgi:hypothetical protein